MRVTVVGMGLFGRSLAVSLARAGAEVIALDIEMQHLDDVRDEVSLAVCLDATDEKELRAQNIHTSDVLVASIGDDFEANQFLVVLAKEMGVPKVLARAPSWKHARILKLLGADEVVLPEVAMAERTARRLLEAPAEEKEQEKEREKAEKAAKREAAEQEAKREEAEKAAQRADAEEAGRRAEAEEQERLRSGARPERPNEPPRARDA